MGSNPTPRTHLAAYAFSCVREYRLAKGLDLAVTISTSQSCRMKAIWESEIRNAASVRSQPVLSIILAVPMFRRDLSTPAGTQRIGSANI